MALNYWQEKAIEHDVAIDIMEAQMLTANETIAVLSPLVSANITAISSLQESVSANTTAISTNAAALADIVNYAAIVDNGSDVYPIDMASRQYKNIRIATADADAKEVTVSNVPAGDAELFIELTYTNAAAITWTLKAGSTVIWLTGAAPTLSAGKVYYIAALTSDGGTTWRCNSVGGW
jgi:hypothetical protein